MTDNEIIKALECCTSGTTSECCNKCPFSPEDICDKDGNALEKYALALINRQKAEIEMLQDLIEEAQQYNEAWVADNGKLRKEAKNIKADAVKEFAERVKEKIRTMSRIVVYDEDIDNLVKEFTEGG